jgi:hypothetical protein
MKQQIIRLNRRLRRVTLDGREYGRWATLPEAVEAVSALLAETTDTHGRPVARTCPDLPPRRWPRG